MWVMSVVGWSGSKEKSKSWAVPSLVLMCFHSMSSFYHMSYVSCCCESWLDALSHNAVIGGDRHGR
jgi:hypothetical protein